jgi:hypothetical protein
VISDANSVEFVSPIVGLRLIADPSYAERVSRPKIALKIGLVDAQGNWIASDKDRTVLLRADPATGGVLGKAEITIPKGNSVAETTFVPSGEGKTTIKAVVREGLVVEPSEIEFKYASMYFWFLAALGGLIGGGVRNAIGTDHSAKRILLHCLGGAVTGLLTYLLLPLIISLSLKPANLQTSSKVFEAFVWGFIGGGSGTPYWGEFLPRPKPPKQHSHSGSNGDFTKECESWALSQFMWLMMMRILFRTKRYSAIFPASCRRTAQNTRTTTG